MALLLFHLLLLHLFQSFLVLLSDFIQLFHLLNGFFLHHLPFVKGNKCHSVLEISALNMLVHYFITVLYCFLVVYIYVVDEVLMVKLLSFPHHLLDLVFAACGILKPLLKFLFLSLFQLLIMLLSHSFKHFIILHFLIK